MVILKFYVQTPLRVRVCCYKNVLSASLQLFRDGAKIGIFKRIICEAFFANWFRVG
jgi:hypothetical protein